MKELVTSGKKIQMVYICRGKRPF